MCRALGDPHRPLSVRNQCIRDARRPFLQARCRRNAERMKAGWRAGSPRLFLSTSAGATVAGCSTACWDTRSWTKRARSPEGTEQRLVLAHLLARANEVVPAEWLIDEIWADEPPEAAPKRSIELRLASPRCAGQGPDREPGGQLSASRRARGGRRPSLRSPPRGGAPCFRPIPTPRRRSRGSALAGAPARRRPPATCTGRDRAPGEPPVAAEHRIAAELALGRYGRSSTARSLIEQHPRGVWAALCALPFRPAGQALASYQRARAELVEELGIEPLARTPAPPRQILNADPARELSAAPRRRPRPLPRASSREPSSAAIGISRFSRGGMGVVTSPSTSGWAQGGAQASLSARRGRISRPVRARVKLRHPSITRTWSPFTRRASREDSCSSPCAMWRAPIFARCSASKALSRRSKRSRSSGRWRERWTSPTRRGWCTGT